MKTFDVQYQNFLKLEKLPTIESKLAFFIKLVESGLIYENNILKARNIEVYVRFSTRSVQGQTMRMLDITSIKMAEKIQGRGWFSSFETIVEAICPWEAVRYELVDNEFLYNHFKKRGLYEENANFYWFKKNPQDCYSFKKFAM